MRLRDCRADVYRVGSCASPRLCLPSVVGGGARFCRGGVPLRLGFPGGVDKAMATAAQGNKVSRPLPRPGVALLQLHRRGRGVLLRSLRSVSLPSYLMGWLLAFFCFKDAATAAGGVAVWRWIPTRSSLDGGRRW